ncbi:MAG: HNH endonuclease [Lentisphaerae bacterium]|nr:MAG: HNH endonuclease [Lentisphaerota bacterium]
MPDREVESIRDLLYYQYAKIMAKSAFRTDDGQAAKRQHYGFIKETLRALKNGKKTWSEITREDKQLVEKEKKCFYCGSEDDLQWEHIVPKSIRIKCKCSTCHTIQAIHNMIRACKSCNLAKRTMGLYEFFKAKYPDDTKFYDRIPPLLEKKYLKTIWNCHECAGTLDVGDLDGDGRITVLDIDQILHRSTTS